MEIFEAIKMLVEKKITIGTEAFEPYDKYAFINDCNLFMQIVAGSEIKLHLKKDKSCLFFAEAIVDGIKVKGYFTFSEANDVLNKVNEDCQKELKSFLNKQED